MLETLSLASFSWMQVGAAVLGLVLALFLGLRTHEREQRRRIQITGLMLVLSVVLHVVGVSVDLMVKGDSERMLNGAAVLLLAFGLTGLTSLLLFDVAFRKRFTVPTFLRDLIQAGAFFIILLVVLRRSGVNLLSLVTTSAVLTAVIGLALQNTIANMFAGLSLQLDHTLNEGDWIQMGNRIGRITHIKWRSTFLVTRDGNNVILPNSELLRQEVLNFSKPSSVHRSQVHVSFHYRHPPREVARILVGALRGYPPILATPEPDCLPIEFGESAIQYALRYWTDNIADDIIIEGEVRTRIWYAAQRAGLEIPFPIRTVHQVQLSTDADAEARRLARIDALGRIDIFSKLEAAELQLLADCMRRHAFTRGEVILHEGDVGDSLYIVHHGDVSVTIGKGGSEVARIGPGDFFGEMSLMTGEPRSATCRALGEVECWVIDRDGLRGILAQKPKVAEDISGILASRMMALDGKRARTPAPVAAVPDPGILKRIRAFFSLS
jgi:small-conductance mechanosensitive channel/CRP-like cAMP-binding protein